jgi:hypothetical protein
LLFISCNETNKVQKAIPTKSASTNQLAPAAKKPRDKTKATEPVDKTGAAYELDGYRLVLYSSSTTCSVGYRLNRAGTVEKRLKLALDPPCNWVLRPYRTAERSRKTLAGRILLGEQGGPLAWKYLDSTNTTVVVVIGGDPLADEILDKSRPDRLTEMKKDRCGSQIQAVLITPEQVRLSRDVERTGSYCPKYGYDETLFWVFAHEK